MFVKRYGLKGAKFAIWATTVLLKVEQNQLVIDGWGCDLVNIRRTHLAIYKEVW